MFSNFSANLTGWVSDAQKTVQKGVTELGNGVQELMKEPAKPENLPVSENSENPAEPVEHIEPENLQKPKDPNEVLNQVSKKIVADVSSVWGSAISMGKSAYAKVEANEYVKQATTVITETASSGLQIIDNAPFVKDFNQEQEKFIAENKIDGDVKVPWVGYKNEETLKEQILTLSKDKRNFLRAPPAGAQFEFDYKICQPLALAILEKDPNLVDMRFQLVPKVTKEEAFWKNYFYRISLIKQNAEPLDEPVIIIPVISETDSITEDEFASEEVGEVVPEWEKELHDELQEYEVVEEDEGNGEWEKELEDMLGEAPPSDLTTQGTKKD